MAHVIVGRGGEEDRWRRGRLTTDSYYDRPNNNIVETWWVVVYRDRLGMHVCGGLVDLLLLRRHDEERGRRTTTTTKTARGRRHHHITGSALRFIKSFFALAHEWSVMICHQRRCGVHNGHTPKRRRREKSEAVRIIHQRRSC